MKVKLNLECPHCHNEYEYWHEYFVEGEVIEEEEVQKEEEENGDKGNSKQ